MNLDCFAEETLLGKPLLMIKINAIYIIDVGTHCVKFSLNVKVYISLHCKRIFSNLLHSA